MKSVSLFPSTVYIDRINDTDWLVKALEYTKNFTDLSADDCSVRGGWQSKKDLYTNPLFMILADKIFFKLGKINKVPDNCVPCITAMWLNIQKQHGFNHVHVHPGAWYAGVVYLQCTDLTGDLIFYDPRPAAEVSLFYENLVQVGERGGFRLKPKTGDLVLFPGYLPHGVEPNSDTELRISISFNIELTEK
jgi:uncharacterized protein (TIGR02466 family)